MGPLLSILLFVAFFYLMMRFGCGAHAAGGGCGHGSHGDQKMKEHCDTQDSSTPRQITHDPVCGMEIEVNQAPHSTTYGSDSYYFCSKDCYAKFQERPGYFVEIQRRERRYIA
jgi:YHS domain-containing protein